VRLPLRDHLHAVLQAAQEKVAVGEVVPVAARDEAREEQPVERAERSPLAQVDVLAAVQELQRLDEELDLPDAARTELEVEPAPATGFPLRPRLQRPHLLHRTEVEVLAPDERREPAERLLADGEVAGDGARLEEREPFPVRSLRLVIQLERPRGVHDGAAAPFRAQVEIDAEDESPLRGRVLGADRAGHFLGEAGVEGEVVDGLGTLRSPVGVVEVEDVDVAREVELPGAQLSHSEHAEPARADGRPPGRRAVLGAEPRVVERDRRFEGGRGEAGKLRHRLDQGRASRQLAERDAQDIDDLAAPQGPGELRGRSGGRDAPAVGRGESLAGEQVDEPRPGGEMGGEKPRGSADRHERSERRTWSRPAQALMVGRKGSRRSGQRAVGIGARRAEREDLLARGGVETGIAKPLGRPRRTVGLLPGGRGSERLRRFGHAQV
jgi:hypothetical protein